MKRHMKKSLHLRKDTAGTSEGRQCSSERSTRQVSKGICLLRSVKVKVGDILSFWRVFEVRRIQDTIYCNYCVGC